MWAHFKETRTEPTGAISAASILLSKSGKTMIAIPNTNYKTTGGNSLFDNKKKD